MERMRLAAIGLEPNAPSSSSSSPGDAVEEVRKLRLQKDRLEGLCRALTAQVKAQQQQQQQQEGDEGAAKSDSVGQVAALETELPAKHLASEEGRE
jgi:hypothetical protein